MDIDRDFLEAFRNEVRAGFSAIGERLDRVEARLDRVEARLDRVEARLDQLELRQGDSESRIARIEQGMFELLDRSERLEHNLQSLDIKMMQGFEATNKRIDQVALDIIDLKQRVSLTERRLDQLNGGDALSVQELPATYNSALKDFDSGREHMRKFLAGELPPLTREEYKEAKEQLIKSFARFISEMPIQEHRFSDEIRASRDTIRPFLVRPGNPDPDFSPEGSRRNAVAFLASLVS